MSKTQKFLVHAGLILFGLLIGFVAVEIALEILHHFKKGSEFENIADLRSSIVSASNNNPAASRGNTTLGEIVVPSADDRIIYELKPDLNVRFQRAQVRTNSLGMRGPEYAIPKPADTYRIALLGDSFAFGWGVEEQESFGSVLERNLNRLGGGHPKFEVLNLAVPGYSTFQEVALFEEKGLCFDADAILVYFVQNDFGLPFFVRDIRSGSTGTGGLFSALEFSRLTWKATNPNAQEELAKMQGWDPGTSLNKLMDTADRYAIPVFLAVNPKKSQNKDLSRIGKARKRTGMHIIELREGLVRAMDTRGIDAKQLTLSFDPHPSPLRHQILGDIMTPHFRAALEIPR